MALNPIVKTQLVGGGGAGRGAKDERSRGDSNISSVSTIRNSFKVWVLENTQQVTDDINESKVEQTEHLQYIYSCFWYLLYFTTLFIFYVCIFYSKSKSI